MSNGCRRMNDAVTKPKTRTKTRTKVERPRLYKVILVNDDFTPREFVTSVLKAEFRMTDDQAYKVMMTAHQRGVCVVAVFTKDVAETKATRATDARGRAWSSVGWARWIAERVSRHSTRLVGQWTQRVPPRWSRVRSSSTH